MKIYEGENDGVIGELLYQTVEFTKKEFTDKGIGVISQGTVQRYLAEERPDLKIKKLGSFKFDNQENTVTVRIGTPVQKLLGPGYDELKEKYQDMVRVSNRLVCEILESEKQLLAIQNNYDSLIEKYQITGGKLSELYKKYDELKKKYDELQHEKDIIGRLYDALVIAVAKDVQKFSDLLVENEELKGQNIALAECAEIDVQIGIKGDGASEDAADLGPEEIAEENEVTE